ncbi:type II toxin-antitoxin system VapC family toxin [Rhodopseudomonas palustris]|uniref:Ribonuclease VapC n=1 Tax=Rhodopseudomonas palustris (strain BisB18) TaxID=316056 RepID=Q211P8_RHOPB
MYLVDTNVISAGAPSRAAPAALIAWMDHHSPQLYISAVTVAEIGDGIAKARREGATRKASDLDAWLDTLLHLYSERVLTFDAATARVAGMLSDRARGKGQAPGFADIIIAATALQHGLTVLSRNLKHFEPLGVPTLDPFATLPTPR